jgi:hypothetical protein
MFKRIEDATDSTTQAIAWMIKGIEAVYTDKRLAMYTTNGRVRGAREWFIRRMATIDRLDYESERIGFRAWDLTEAIEKANTNTRLMQRIIKLANTLNSELPYGG